MAQGNEPAESGISCRNCQLFATSGWQNEPQEQGNYNPGTTVAFSVHRPTKSVHNPSKSYLEGSWLMKFWPFSSPDTQIMEKYPDLSMTTLHQGENVEFYLIYSVFNGHRVQINFKFKHIIKTYEGPFYNGPNKFTFHIKNVNGWHSGVYKIEILDKGRPRIFGRNPATIEWQVEVRKFLI